MNATERAQAKLIGEEVMRLRDRVALLEGLLREATGRLGYEAGNTELNGLLRRVNAALADAREDGGRRVAALTDER